MDTDAVRPAPDPLISPIGPRLRQRREELGLSCAELTERLDGAMTVQQLEWLESQRIVFPSWIRLLRLAEALDVSPEYLVGAE
jgi:transcriptional regulator with XRE-family HTH domain